MSAKQKKTLARVVISAALLALTEIAARLFQLPQAARLVLLAAAYATIGWDVLWKAIRNIGHGQVFDENFLMSVATVGAFAVGEYPEGVAVMLFYQIGELFQSFAVGRSRESIAALMNISPDYANLVGDDGSDEKVDPDDVEVGSVILVRPGEKIPLDGVVVEGESSLDTAALTGESLPRSVAAGDSVVSGCVSMSGLLKIRTTKKFGESTVSRILELVESAADKKAKAENFITRFARWYTPLVVFCALALAVIPSIFTGNWGEWIHRALIFLVISCPCALVISIPLTFFGGIGGASRHGVLVKGGNYLEALANVGVVVFDKTGTLTKGDFTVTGVYPAQGADEKTLVETAALAESYSSHPIAAALMEKYGSSADKNRVGKVEEIAGHGVSTDIDGEPVLVGNARLMRRGGIDFEERGCAGTSVYAARGGKFLGTIVISDTIKDGAREAISALRAEGVRKTVMLTGDRAAAAEGVAKELGVDEMHAELLPEDKVDKVEELLTGKRRGEELAFVGDGINDAPVLSRADVGIAMGAMGSDAAIEAADVVLMDDDPRKIAVGIRLARKAMRIVRENIVFALLIKFSLLALGAIGLANMWEAVFADVGVMIICVLNSTRMLRKEKKA